MPGANRQRAVMRLLDDSAAAESPIAFDAMDDRERTIAVGINQMLTSLCSGRALNITKGNKEGAAERLGGVATVVRRVPPEERKSLRALARGDHG